MSLFFLLSRPYAVAASAFHTLKTGRLALQSVMMIVVITFLAQLGLQSRALPGEMAGTTFERVTGLHLQPMPHCAMEVMPPHAGQTPPPPSHNSQHPHPESCCFLCPLLHLQGMAQLTHLGPFISRVTITFLSYRPSQPRAPPAAPQLLRPPARGPPHSP